MSSLTMERLSGLARRLPLWQSGCGATEHT